MKILCSISTKNRYENYLPIVIVSIANQTRKPDHFTLYDDSDSPKDLRAIEIYEHLFHLLDYKGIPWNVVFGKKSGQHNNHQTANMAGFDAVWRMDDDCSAEPDVLEKLEKHLVVGVGAVGGSILNPLMPITDAPSFASSMIGEMDKPNKQWFKISRTEEVDHLHCSFLYLANIVNYDTRLSKKAHREETMFTYSLKLKGFKILITPCITWHFRSKDGGIRSDNEMSDYHHDEQVFRDWLKFKQSGKPLYVLNNGLGDNYMFLNNVKMPKGAVVATCYPELYKEMGVELISIADAWKITNVEAHNIYGWCAQNNWKKTMPEAIKEFYENSH